MRVRVSTIATVISLATAATVTAGVNAMVLNSVSTRTGDTPAVGHNAPAALGEPTKTTSGPESRQKPEPADPAVKDGSKTAKPIRKWPTNSTKPGTSANLWLDLYDEESEEGDDDADEDSDDDAEDQDDDDDDDDDDSTEDEDDDRDEPVDDD